MAPPSSELMTRSSILWSKQLSGLSFSSLPFKNRSNRFISPKKTKILKRRPTSAEYNDLASVLAFSAFPFLAVKAIANSGAGTALAEGLERRRSALEADKLATDVARERARAESSWYGQARPKFFPFLPPDYFPSYLEGEAPGDFGFDPLGLAKDKGEFERLFNLEVLHARWAMLSALGVLVPESLQALDQEGYQFLDPVWWSIGYSKLAGDNLDYLGIPGLHIAGGQGVAIIAIAQFMLMLGPEYARFTGIKALEPLGIFLPGDENYPGGFLFDPLSLSRSPSFFEDMRVREMKNGRLAMVAWVGFAAQAYLTRQGPVENLREFLSDPYENNLIALYFPGLIDKVGVRNALGRLGEVSSALPQDGKQFLAEWIRNADAAFSAWSEKFVSIVPEVISTSVKTCLEECFENLDVVASGL